MGLSALTQKASSKIYTFLFLVAITLAIIGTLFIFPSITPYRLKPQSIHEKLNSVNAYQLITHDFDRDGFSEFIYLIQDTTAQITGLLIHNFQGNPLGQWNVQGDVNYTNSNQRWILFHDFNKDQYDDIFVFHQLNDTLFLSVINVLKRDEFFIEKVPLVVRQEKMGKAARWDIFYFHKLITDLENDGNEELIFTLTSGYSLTPRGIYRFDLNKRQITHFRKLYAAIISLKVGDLDNDGKKEIFLGTYASDNWPADSAYTDAYSWLFVLDNQFNFKFPPRQFYGFTSGVLPFFINYNNKPYLWVITYFGGVSEINGEALLINANGKIQEKKNLPFRLFNIMSIIEHGTLTSLVCYIKRHEQLVRFTPVFQPVHQIRQSIILRDWQTVDVNWDGTPEILIHDKNTVYLYSKDLKLLAQTPLKDWPYRISNIFIKWRGVKQLPEIICVAPYHQAKLLELQRNPLYTYRFLTFPLLTGLFFIAFLGIHRIFTLIYIYLGFFLNYLNSTVNGVIIIDNRNRIVSFNSRVSSILNLKPLLEKGMKFQEALADFPAILHKINVAQQTNTPVQDVISLNHPDGPTQIRIFVKPLLGLWRIPYGYLIELQSENSADVGERTRIWAKTVQKLAHDIKAPLTSIRVGLRTVQYYIEQSDIPNKTDLIDDLNTLTAELARVHEITRNFLKFVNLEKPNFALIDIHAIIEKSLQHFQGFFKEGGGNIQLEKQYDTSITNFLGDAQQLEMVFNVLIENAIDAMQGEGTLTIQTTQIDNVLEDATPFCEIEITDTGKGLTKEEIDKIFQPFYTTKEHGSGMGLTIAKKIIEDHRGTLTVYSKPNLGTTFRIVIPIYR